jgi:hypothetical protein
MLTLCNSKTDKIKQTFSVHLDGNGKITLPNSTNLLGEIFPSFVPIVRFEILSKPLACALCQERYES